MNTKSLRLAIVALPALLGVGLVFLSLSALTREPAQPKSVAKEQDILIPLTPPPEPVSSRQTGAPEEPSPEAIDTPPLPTLTLDNRHQTASSISLKIQPAAKMRPDMKLDLSPSMASFNSMASPDQLFSEALPVNYNPTVLQRTPPSYPPSALRRRLEGYVVVEFTVSREGMVIQDTLEIIESTPPGTFDRVVLRSLLRWRFEPLSVNGEPRDYRARQKIDFKLNS